MLDMRRRLKDELGIPDRTTIATCDNNPLKHLDAFDDVLAWLVDARRHGRSGFMSPVAAVDDAVADLCRIRWR